jgi:uncharacterized protein YqjF (DUF2071 family)
MNDVLSGTLRRQSSSELARQRFVAVERTPTFLCEWRRVIFVHYEADRSLLQREVPFELELFEGRAVVSLVAFTMRRFRPHRGGALTKWLFLPAATNHFFNIRTYVRHHNEPGVYFITQLLSHPFCLLGRLPRLRLPWHWGRMDYQHAHETGRLTGQVAGNQGTRLTYSATLAQKVVFVPPATGSLAEFTMERYTAFALRGGKEVSFRVWHEPWPQCPIQIDVKDACLLHQTGDWHRHACLAGANYTIGCNEVWMGRVRQIHPGLRGRLRTSRGVLSAFYDMP